MSEPLPPDLLSRPPAEAARLVALAQLQRTEDAARRVAVPDDAEALHDFRVAVRRLRSLLRSHRPLLDSAASRPSLRRLRRVARSTNPGRDAEVQLAWVQSHLMPAGAPAGPRRAARWLVSWLEARRGEVAEDVDRARSRFEEWAPDLRRRLATYRVTLVRAAPSDEATSYGQYAAAILRDDAERLGRRLTALADSPDDESAHRARLAAKRLRYDLEPLLDLLPQETKAAAELKRLQDLLGELNDANVFLATLGEAIVDAAKERARAAFAAARADGSRSPAARRRRGSSGLLTLVDAARARKEKAEQAFAAWSRQGSAPTLAARIEGIAATAQAG